MEINPDADLIRIVGEAIKNALPVRKKGDIYTLGTLERTMQNLRHPFSGEYLPEPSPEELRQAIQNVRDAFGKIACLHTPEVKNFVRKHPIIKIKFIGKKDPHSNPTEGLVNRRLSAAVSVNRNYANLAEL